MDNEYYEYGMSIGRDMPMTIPSVDKNSTFPIESKGVFTHNKRGSRYDVVSDNASVQDASGGGLQEGDSVVVYVDTVGRFWVRKNSEFHDGRFSKAD
jgi:hypothetical protein